MTLALHAADLQVGPAEKPGFECKEQGLIVTRVETDGKAECSGVSVGMTLIGFQTERLDATKLTWSKVKAFAAKAAPPHTYIFSNETTEMIPEGVPPTEEAATAEPAAEPATEPSAEVDAAVEPSAEPAAEPSAEDAAVEPSAESTREADAARADAAAAQEPDPDVTPEPEAPAEEQADEQDQV
eukprot:COSAG02_NODE_5247_length_4505_cov_1.758511_3_plen_184_part_00